MAQARRKDKARTVLRKGEGQRSNGTYYYRWQDKKGNRHYLYAKSLQELREQEKQVEKDKYDGIKAEARYVTVNDLYEQIKYPHKQYNVIDDDDDDYYTAEDKKWDSLGKHGL